jgi:hypothetical protein
MCMQEFKIFVFDIFLIIHSFAQLFWLCLVKTACSKSTNKEHLLQSRCIVLLTMIQFLHYLLATMSHKRYFSEDDHNFNIEFHFGDMKKLTCKYIEFFPWIFGKLSCFQHFSTGINKLFF